MANNPIVRVLPSVARPVATTFGIRTPDSLETPCTPTRPTLDRTISIDSATTTSGLDNLNDPPTLVLKAFLPTVAVFPSRDVEELVRLKGIYGGLCGLLKPFGENVQGKVAIRDSTGLSKSWEGLGIRFVPFLTDIDAIPNPFGRPGVAVPAQDGDWSSSLRGVSERRNRDLDAIDEVLDYHLRHSGVDARDENPHSVTPSYYGLFLRKMFAQGPMVPYETFSHPVGCVIAVSSQNPSPIDTLRDLYHDTRKESHILPSWVSNEFLRYYVLVHDDDHDDIAKSSALFSQMKRHFGLHCHMLRLRSVECIASDSGMTVLPDTEWLSADDEIQIIKQKGTHFILSPETMLTGIEQSASINELQQYLFDTDASVIRAFVKELLNQSILPFMETRVSTWNDQVASRRRGLGGRFMSLSKRWTGFGVGRATKSSTTNSQSNYDFDRACYDADAPEAMMHRLADFAFTLRDWKLAYSTYDLLKSDFADDKAWNHHAIVNKMAALSMLIGAQANHSRVRVDIVDQLIDTASYSFLTRCNNACGAIRCLMLAFELYKNRGGAAIEEAIKWGDRLLELFILSPIIQVLLVERLAVCYHAQPGFGTEQWSSCLRKAAFWDLLTSTSWLALQYPVLAVPRFEAAAAFYRNSDPESGVEIEIAPFEGMQDLLVGIEREISLGQGHPSSAFGGPFTEQDSFVEEVEKSTRPKHSRHKSSTSRISVSRAAPPKDTIELFHRLNLPTNRDDGSLNVDEIHRHRHSRGIAQGIRVSNAQPVDNEEAMSFFNQANQELEHKEDGFTCQSTST